MSISGIIADFDALLVGDKYNALFSTYSNMGSGTYIYHTNFWASGINLTCHSVYNSAHNKHNATAISKKVVAMANHIALPSGTTLRFTNGTYTHTNHIVETHNIAGDLTLGVLEQPLPQYIRPCDIYTGEATVPYTKPYMPVLVIDQEQKALVLEMRTMDSYNDIYVTAPSPFVWNRTKYYEALVDGDSGSPVFVLEDGKPKLINCLFTTTGGPSYLHYQNEIKDFIAKHPSSAEYDMIAEDLRTMSDELYEEEGQS